MTPARAHDDIIVIATEEEERVNDDVIMCSCPCDTASYTY